MLAALRARAEGAVADVAARLSPAYESALPIAVKLFHYGWIPFVLLLGMRSERSLKLTDLLSPM